MAYLAALPPEVLQSVLARIGVSASSRGAQRRRELESVVAQGKKRGYSIAAFMPGNEAVDRAFIGPDHQLYAMNISFEAREGSKTKDCKRFAQVLKDLIDAIQQAWGN